MIRKINIKTYEVIKFITIKQLGVSEEEFRIENVHVLGKNEENPEMVDYSYPKKDRLIVILGKED